MLLIIFRIFFVVLLGFLVFEICEYVYPALAGSARLPDDAAESTDVQAAAAKDESMLGKRKILNIPYINQLEHYPNGCESVSAVMVLQYLDVDITVEDFVNLYLDKGMSPCLDEEGRLIGCDPWKAYPGSPYDETGWGCFAPVIVNAMNKFLDKSEFVVEEMCDVPLETLCAEFIDNDIPVLIWATVDMDETREGNTWTVPDTGKRISWINPMHCLVLVGYDDTDYYFNDPMSKKQCGYRKKDVESAYKAMGCQAIAVYN